MRARTHNVCAACPYGAGAFTSPTGTIAIPPAGTGTYANSVVCEYMITTGAPIYLRFDSFATEAGMDTVKIYDGTSATGAPTGTFSGTAIPPVQVATSGSMFIRFTSDSNVVRAGVAMSWSSSVLTQVPTLAPTESPFLAADAERADAGGVCHAYASALFRSSGKSVRLPRMLLWSTG
jgi:hypothetical protein